MDGSVGSVAFACTSPFGVTERNLLLCRLMIWYLCCRSFWTGAENAGSTASTSTIIEVVNMDDDILAVEVG